MEPSEEDKDKLFFTTTDLLNKINSVIQENQEESSSDAKGGFELQRRLPDGSTRLCTKDEAAAADFQAKLKQAGRIVSVMETSQEKLDWAESHRKKGNELFVKGKYKEAMDVYLTCLVAIEKPKSNNANDCSVSDMTDKEWEDTVEKLVKLPVLLNLSACALKLGMFKKTCQFCNFGIELECGKSSAKLYFRRGKAKISLTEYDEARIDLNKCLTLLQKEEEVMDGEMDSKMMEAIYSMKRSVEKELKRLDNMISISKRNYEKQAKAMKKVLGGDGSNNTSNNTESRDVEEDEKILDEIPLYSEKNGLREFSRLRAPPRNYFSSSLEKKEENVSRSSAFVCCIRAVEHVLRKMLFLLGDEEAMTKNFDDDDDGDYDYDSDDDEQNHRKVD